MLSVYARRNIRVIDWNIEVIFRSDRFKTMDSHWIAVNCNMIGKYLSTAYVNMSINLNFDLKSKILFQCLKMFYLENVSIGYIY